MPKISPPAPPYLGPAKFHGGAQGNRGFKRIVIHCTVSPCVAGGARATASYFKRSVTRPSSAHYVVDPGEVVQVVGDHTVAYHAPPNGDTIGVELCDPQAGSPARWGDTSHHAMLLKAARLVAQLGLAYGIPLRKLGPLQLRVGLRGVCGHVDVSNAWKQTTHTDPGVGFPWDEFMAMVAQAARALQTAVPPPVVKPTHPVPSGDPTGGTSVHLVTANIRNLPNLTRSQERHDLGLVKALGSVVLWQEIAEANDVADLRATLPSWTHVHTDTECPISVWTSKWDVVEKGQALLHGGMKGVSPHRVATWAVLQRKGHNVAPFAVVNTHFVSGAFTHPGQVAEEWRVHAWTKAQDGLADVVAMLNGKGYTVVGGGDFNRTGSFPGFSSSHRWLVNGGFDHLYASEVPTGLQVRVGATGSLGKPHLFTDHAARWALLHLTAPTPHQ